MPLASMLLPLSGKQKSTLAIVARKAYDRVGIHSGEDFNTWRAREAVEACGKRISEATNGDFNKLLAHFENLAGNSGAALKATLRDQTEEPRQIMHAIDQLLTEHGYKPGYASTICMDRFKVTMDKATPAQLHQIRMTLKTRFAKKRQSQP